MKIKKNWILFAILLLAAVLRLWSLGSIPPHLTPDEAALGYNAYSILKTGKDEYGKLFPAVFKSFGDFKPGLYIYLTIPFVATLGLDELAVRLPSVLAGVAAVWLIYLVTNRFFNKKTAIMAALLLAISPWHIHFSRGAWEANLSLTLTLAGVYFFLKSLKQQKYLILSAFLFALTYVGYQGAKLATTIPILILALVYWKQILKIDRKIIAISIIVGLFICVPIFSSFLQGKTGRLKVFSVFSYSRPAEYLQNFLDQGNEKVGDLTYYLFHSKSLDFTRGILSRWSNHFSGRFLFFEGDWQNPRHSAPYNGMFIFADIVLFILGFVALVRSKAKGAVFVLLWLVLSPLPAALSRDQVHAIRALNLVIPLTMISAFGASSLLQAFKKRKSCLKVLVLIFGLFYLANYAYFLDAYFVHLPKHNSKYWFYGYKQAVKIVSPIQADYQKIIFQQSYNQPYIYFLFYQRYDPAEYQVQAKLTESGIDVGLVEEFDNISFEFFSWPPVAESGTLIVGDAIVIPDNFSREDYNLVSEIKHPDGMETAFRILEVR